MRFLAPGGEGRMFLLNNKGSEGLLKLFMKRETNFDHYALFPKYPIHPDSASVLNI